MLDSKRRCDCRLRDPGSSRFGMNLVVGSVYGGFRGLPLPPIDPERVIWFEPLQTTAVVRSPKTAGAGASPLNHLHRWAWPGPLPRAAASFRAFGNEGRPFEGPWPPVKTRPSGRDRARRKRLRA